MSVKVFTSPGKRESGVVEHERGVKISVQDGHLFVHTASAGYPILAAYAPAGWISAEVVEAKPS